MVKRYLTENGIRTRNVIYNFSKGCSMFVANKDGYEKDIRVDANKTKKRSLWNIGYKRKGDTRSKRTEDIDKLRLKTISPREDFFTEETVYYTTEEKEIKLVV